MDIPASSGAREKGEGMTELAVVEMPKPKKERKRRRDYGTGRVYLRGNTWWIQYYANGQQIRESSGSDKKSVAETQLHEKMVDAQNGAVAPKKQTYEQLRDALYDHYETQKFKSLFRRADGTRYLGPVPALDRFFAEWKAEQINTPALKDFVRQRQAEGASNSNINHALRVLRRMFWLQVEENHFPQSLVPYFPLLKKDAARKDYLTQPEFDKVVKHLPPSVRPLAIVAFNSGARKSELLKLRWQTVNLKDGFMTFRDTKNGEDRDVPIIGAARTALEALRKAHPDAEFVFVGKNGQRLRDFRRAWQKATERAGLAGRKFHGLRRGMATRLMESGIDSQTARLITGHKDAATFEQYRQLRRDAILQAGRKLERAQRATK
jgi:integrase